MTEPGPDRKAARRKVVLAAACYPDARSALDFAAAIAGAGESALAAILVEEDAILSAAGLPFLRVVPAGGGSALPVTIEAMRAAFERDALMMRDMISETARRLQSEWSFEVRRGQIRSLLEMEGTPGEIAVFGFQRLRRGQAEAVLAIDANTPESGFLETALDTVRRTGHFVRILVTGETPETTEQRARELSGRLMPSTRISGVEVAIGRTEFLSRIGKSHAAAILIDRHLASGLGIDALLEAGRCPVLVFSG